jgi:hypothetical protein
MGDDVAVPACPNPLGARSCREGRSTPGGSGASRWRHRRRECAERHRHWEVGSEVGDGETIHQWKNPRRHGEGFLNSVVTIGLGGLMGLSEGLATQRERDLGRWSRYPPI